MTMTEPRFPVQVIGGVPVVITPQEVDITNAGALRAALLHASAARPGADVVADMTRTWFCDCAGLHALAGAHKRARAEGRQVTLAVTGAPVRRILALTALDRLLPVCTSLDQALARSRARRRQEPADHLLLGAGTTGHTGPPRTAAEAGRVPGSRPGTWLPARTAAGHGELTTPLRLHGGDRP